LGPSNEATQELLTPDALRFIGLLCHKFDACRHALSAAWKAKAKEYDAGEVPHFIADSKHPARDPNWHCAPVPADVQDHCVEITGSIDHKMVINGLNSGASVYMADFEDSTSPMWMIVTGGHLNLWDDVRGTISYTKVANGKVYALD